MGFDIRERSKRFAIRIIGLVRVFPKDVSSQILGQQLVRAGTSVGANLEEADAASSRKDFLHKVTISYKEARESRYWLDLIISSKLFNNQLEIKEAESLREEAVELSKILFSIINSTKTANN